MRFRLIPSNDDFFVYFSQSASNLAKAAKGLRAVVDATSDREARHADVRALERAGDDLTREILRHLDTTFVTPFDREDIHALAEQLDDVVDDIYHLSETLAIVPVDQVLPEFDQQVDVLVVMAERTVELVDRLSQMKGLRPIIEEIDKLESDGDGIYRRALGRLFSGELDVLEVVKWKDLTRSAEDAIDGIEDVSDTIASILVKHA
jgi:uncharacterized protein